MDKRARRGEEANSGTLAPAGHSRLGLGLNSAKRGINKPASRCCCCCHCTLAPSSRKLLLGERNLSQLSNRPQAPRASSFSSCLSSDLSLEAYICMRSEQGSRAPPPSTRPPKFTFARLSGGRPRRSTGSEAARWARRQMRASSGPAGLCPVGGASWRRFEFCKHSRGRPIFQPIQSAGQKRTSSACKPLDSAQSGGPEEGASSEPPQLVWSVWARTRAEVCVKRKRK